MIDSAHLTEAGGVPFVPVAAASGAMSPTDETDTSIDIASSEYFDAPQWRPMATDTESRASTSENDEKENIFPDIPPAILPSDDITGPQDEIYDNLASLAEVSPSPSAVIPRAPPTTPATPKREIKLVTAGSSAADWFTRGFVGFHGKKEVKEEKPTVAEEKVDELHTQEKVDRLKANVVNLVDSHPQDLKIDPATAVAGTAKMTRTSSFLMVILIEVDIPVEPLGLTAADNHTGPSTIVVNASVTFNLYRPYLRRAVSSPIPEKQPIPEIEQDITTTLPEDRLQSTMPVEPNEALTPDDKSDGSVVFVKPATSNEDAEGVKRKWFREEMRQSPVSTSCVRCTDYQERDGNWTVGEEGDDDHPANMVVTSMKQSVSSISTDFIYVDDGDRPAAKSLVVIPMDINDDIVAEPVTSPPTPADSSVMSAEVHVESVTVQAVKAKYIIIAGKVQKIEDIMKHETPPPETDDTQETPSLEPPPTEVVLPKIKKPKYPPRKSFKNKRETKHKRKPSLENSSDGWSTETEMDDTPIIPKSVDDGGHIEVPGLVTQVTVLETVQVYHLHARKLTL